MPLSPSQTRALLEKLGHNPRRPLGQNFLIDGNIVRKSMELADLEPGDVVLEVGPGLGTLTEAMLERGCLVYGVELDPRLANHLEDTLKSRYPDRFHLVAGDAIAYPRAEIPDTMENLKVVANLPYAITTPWLERMIHPPLPEEMVLMMQKEAADRITAQPGSKAFGAVSIFVGAAYEKAGIHAVSRSCFFPVPGVDSQLLHLKLRPDAVVFAQETRDLIRQVFTQRRKQIGSLVQKLPGLTSWLEKMPDYGCSRTTRPEAIPLAAWLELHRGRAD